MIEQTLRDMAGSYTGSIFDKITDPLECILRSLMDLDEEGHFTYSRLFLASQIQDLLDKIG